MGRGQWLSVPFSNFRFFKRFAKSCGWNQRSFLMTVGIIHAPTPDYDRLFKSALASSHSIAATRAEIAEARSAGDVGVFAISSGPVPAVRTLARKAMQAAGLVRSEISGSLDRDQRPPVEPLERPHAAMRARLRNRLIERTLQMRGMHGIKHRPDVFAGGDFHHPKQRVAIGGLLAFLQRTLMGQKRFQLHEEQQKKAPSRCRPSSSSPRPSACRERRRRRLSYRSKSGRESASQP
jgi:hypothetical protein